MRVAGQQVLPVSDPQHAELALKFAETPHDFSWILSDQDGALVSLAYEQGQLTLTRRGNDPHRYATVTELDDIRIFVDTSSVEIFVNAGTTTFTERYYAKGQVELALAAERECQLHVQAFQLK
ncbi:GH32 C-terminal domain-containing protein [Limosilactobacillus sp.]|uniref:GH32 C-terminal domain-containing protein n=1 Tax=Limosilactobacillus sp. TaxID=2773925 RepID=UPI0025BC3749|nr:GH32 C-terminal domain-containing protein [Limosilactobacillus sp.]MCH3921643.1 GH32 C-terminal domain-containing protein [Limosilactobacillus sp.]MCH3928414.1 GH32 C-terminal domain-containing protein [Limosilactobacillus sp.]